MHPKLPSAVLYAEDATQPWNDRISDVVDNFTGGGICKALADKESEIAGSLAVK